MKKYQIADFIFGIHMEESLDIPENFKKFVIDTDEEVQVEYFLEVVDKLPVIGNQNHARFCFCKYYLDRVQKTEKIRKPDIL